MALRLYPALLHLQSIVSVVLNKERCSSTHISSPSEASLLQSLLRPCWRLQGSWADLLPVLRSPRWRQLPQATHLASSPPPQGDVPSPRWGSAGATLFLQSHCCRARPSPRCQCLSPWENGPQRKTMSEDVNVSRLKLKITVQSCEEAAEVSYPEWSGNSETFICSDWSVKKKKVTISPEGIGSGSRNSIFFFFCICLHHDRSCF